VADAATLLGVLEGAAPDPDDPATTTCPRPPGGDYTRFLDRSALRGARIGVPRAYFYDAVVSGGSATPRGGLTPPQRAVMEDAITELRRLGVVVVDPANIPSVVDADPQRNFLDWPVCAGPDQGKAGDAGCSVTYKYGMKRDFTRWLARLGPAAPLPSLTALREWNQAHVAAGAIKYGQSNLDNADAMDLDADRARYLADRRKDLELTATHGIDEVMRAARLDALLFPAQNGAGIVARAGYPSVIVPFGEVPNDATVPFPPGFDAKPAPFGVTFSGTACSEPTLIGLAYAFEQATRRRVAPSLFP
jgi:amidase